MRGRRLQNTLTALVAFLATGVQAQGMWNFFRDVLHIESLWIRAGAFAFIEAALLVSALRARRYRIEHGRVGVDDAAVWGLAVLGGVLAASDTGDIRAAGLRLAAPLVAAWMFERAISTERADRVGKLGGINWRVTPERVFVWSGLAEPTSRDVSEVARDRRTAAMTVRAHRVHRGGRLAGWHEARLRRLALGADDVMVGEVRARVDRAHRILELTAPGRAAKPARTEPARTEPARAYVRDEPEPARAEPARPVRAEPARSELPVQVEAARTDEDLLGEFGADLRAAHAMKPLTRYKVQKLTGASSRQAERLMNAVTVSALARSNGHATAVE